MLFAQILTGRSNGETKMVNNNGTAEVYQVYTE